MSENGFFWDNIVKQLSKNVYFWENLWRYSQNCVCEMPPLVNSIHCVIIRINNDDCLYKDAKENNNYDNKLKLTKQTKEETRRTKLSHILWLTKQWYKYACGVGEKETLRKWNRSNDADVGFTLPTYCLYASFLL